MQDSLTLTSINARRPLSRILAKVTLLLALVLGALFGALQVLSDLRQEKDAVEYAAEEFLSSVAPSAASAAYNFYLPAAEQVAAGLFTQRAIGSVKIVNEGQVMLDLTRDLNPTLPALAGISFSDPVVLQQRLFAPSETGQGAEIGSISIVVDRAIVAPAFVNRLVSYFLLATLKNVALGILLIAIVYAALARHIVSLADLTGRWSPAQGALKIPPPPRLMRETELELLGHRIERLSDTALGKIREIEESRQAAVKSNSVLSLKSESLSQAIEQQNAELKLANNRLKQLAEHDGLTNLHNRGYFDKRASEVFAAAQSSGEPVAVLLLDVDYFKAYNDYFGHQLGDACLVKVAELIHLALAAEDVLVARYGGEEFVALLVGRGKNMVFDAASEIHQKIREERIEHPRSTIADRITISIGMAMFDATDPEKSQSLDQLISAADEALYEAKRRGRNRTVVSTEEIRKSIRQTRLQAQTLLRAIEEKAFEPFYQPQYDARDGRLVGVEALVRWRDKSGNVVPPNDFMKTASSNGFMPMIDRIVLEEVSTFLRGAKEAGMFIPRISLNVPRENLLERNYVRDVIALAGESDTEVALELLETALFDAPEEIILWQLDALRSGGVDIEIDDFGTGHTSIVSLMSLRPSRLKIAKEIILPMLENNAHETIVRSIIQIGDALQIKVLAEGVENNNVSRKLVDLGCAYQQGYLFAKPMPAPVFLDHFSQKGSEKRMP